MSAGLPINSIYGELRAIYIPASLGFDDPRDVGRALATYRYGFSPEQLETFELLGKGLRNGKLAECLGLVEDKSAKNRVTAVLEKLGVNSRMEAAIIACLYGLGDHSPKVGREQKKS